MQARDHHQTNIKIRKWIPIGILCSLGLSACISASCIASSATITMGEMHGRNVLQPQFGRNKGTFSVPIAIHVEGAKDYTVSLKAENEGKLIDAATSRYILPTTSSSSVNDLSDRWGFYYEYGDSMVTDDEETKNYGPVPTTMTPILPDGSSDVTGNPRGAEVNKILTLGYAANLGDDFAAGNYKGTITVNVVANPLETIHDLYYMQDMSHTACEQTTTPVNTASGHDDDGTKFGNTDLVPRTMLMDLRDNHWYVVEKLADGNCWMTENLALAGGTTLTSADSDIASSYTLPTTEVLANGSTTSLAERVDNTTAFYVSSVGAITDYVYNGDALADGDTTASSNVYKFNYFGLSASQKTAKIQSSYNTWNTNVTDSHTGSYYSWTAAVARSNLGDDNTNQISNADAPGSICPKGWKLPSGHGEFNTLYKAYNNKHTLFKPAFHAIATTGVWGNGQQHGTGIYSDYWSARGTGDTSALYLSVADTWSQPNDGGSYAPRAYGQTIRCVAK